MDLEERLEAQTEAWMPEAGDKIVGTIVELSELESQYGTYPLIIITTEEGREFAIHCFRTVLKNEVAKKRPAVGDRIGVKYFGQLPDKDFHGYKLVIERGEGSLEPAKANPIDFDALVAQTEKELAETPPAPQPEEVPF